MNHIRAIDTLKAKGNDIDQSALRKYFIDYLPQRLDRAMEDFPGDVRENRAIWRLADTLDNIDWHYRRYLKGQAKTLHRIFFEFRKLNVETFGAGMKVMTDVYDTAVEHELYELAARHQKGWNRVFDLFEKTYLP